jgi:hypothetical protein
MSLGMPWRRYSRCTPRVCRSAHQSVSANPMKAAVIALTKIAVSVVIVVSPAENESRITEPAPGDFDRCQISGAEPRATPWRSCHQIVMSDIALSER